MAGELAPILHGIPIVASTNERSALYPAPATNQRVQNLGTRRQERWNGTTWLADAGTITLSPAMFGAAGDATTDDTAALQALLTAAPSRSVVDLSAANGYVISDTLTIANDNVTVIGPAKITAKAGAQFIRMLYATGRSGVVIRDVELDANKANRSSGQTMVLAGLSLINCTDCVVSDVTVRNARGYNDASASAFGISNGTRVKLIACTAVDCGDAGNVPSTDSDAFYMSGEQIVSVGCIATRCTDNGFVLENCLYSKVDDFTVMDCSTMCSITSATSDHNFWRGNNISNGTARVLKTGGTGQIQIAALSTGDLIDTHFKNISLYRPAGDTGSGPAIRIRQPSGGFVLGLTLEDITIDGAEAQGVLIEGASDVRLVNIKVRNVADACIDVRNIAARTVGSITWPGRCVIDNPVLDGGSIGIGVSDASLVYTNGGVLEGNGIGIVASDTSIVHDRLTIVRTPTTDYYSKDAGAGILGLGFRSSQLVFHDPDGSAPAGSLANKVTVRTGPVAAGTGVLGVYGS